VSDYHKINASDLNEMESRPRAQLVNALSGFKSPVLVGSVNDEGVHNLSIVSSLMHLGSSPALMGIVLRPPGEFAHTYKNIKQTEQFTISHVHSDIIKQSHRCSAKYPEHISEFEEVGLTPTIYEAKNWKAPAVDESYIRMGLVLNKIIELPNKCNLMIGDVEWIELNPHVCDQNRVKFDLNDICILGVYDYYKTSHLMKLGYEEYTH
jgi:flavin reductase (DIM6/NTAB) family NADH-FMN oxidoreductase RutF